MNQPIRERLSGITNAGTTVTLSGQQIKPGQLAHVRHLALANASGESVDAVFGVTSQGTFMAIWAKQTVADADAVGVELEFNLLEGDKPGVQVTGTAKKGNVTFIISGTLSDQVPEVVAVEVIAQPAPAAA
jgi:hypothetical protein